MTDRSEPTRVRACPVCGLEVQHTCYHDGEEVRSVLMDAEVARRLRRETREELLERAEAYEEARTSGPHPQHLILRIDPSQAPEVVRIMLTNESCDELWINPWPPRATDSPEIEFTICGGDERHVRYLESRGISVFAWKIEELRPLRKWTLGVDALSTGGYDWSILDGPEATEEDGPTDVLEAS